MTKRATLPPQLKTLLKTVRECVQHERYRFSNHALQRLSERKVDLQDVIYVLKHGSHDQARDTWDVHYQTWNYSIVGKTVDQKNLRIVVNVDASFVVIITVIR